MAIEHTYRGVRPDVAALRAARVGTPLRPLEMLTGVGLGQRLTGTRGWEYEREGWTRPRLPAIPLAPPIDWELAGEDRSWRFRLNAWEPLPPLLARFGETGAPEHLGLPLAIALDWVAQHPTVGAGSAMAWYDVAVGWRAQRLGYLLDAALRTPGVAGDDELDRLARAVLLHADVLADDELVAWHSNHGLLMAAGQLTMARRFGDLGLDPLAEQAEARLATVAEQQFAGDGGHLEHSPGYHLIILRTLIGLADAGVLHDVGLLRLRGSAEHALAWLVQPSGRPAMFGDTDFRQANVTGAADAAEDPALRWALSTGARGAAPSARVHRLAQSGYAVARNWRPAGRESHLALTAAFHSRTHKHADDGSIVWFDRRQDLLIEAGRYGYVGRTEAGSELAEQGFWYSDPGRIYVESTRAHNTVEIDRRSHPRAGVTPYGSGIGRAADEDGCMALEAVVLHGGVHRHRRVVVLRPTAWLLVLDRLEPGDTEPHRYDQRFLFAPRLERVDGAPLAFRIRWGGQARLWLCSLDAASPLEPACGRPEPDLLGWTSPAERELTPCWAGGFGREGTGPTTFATLLGFARRPPEAVAATVGPDGAAARWRLDDREHDVSVAWDEGGALRVTHRRR